MTRWARIPCNQAAPCQGRICGGWPYLLGIYDADGDLIPGTTSLGGGVAPNPRVTFTPAEDGIYFVSASAYSRWFTDPHRGYQYFKSHVGTYTLSVKEVVDDYTSTTETTGTVSVGGWATGEVERHGDRD